MTQEKDNFGKANTGNLQWEIIKAPIASMEEAEQLIIQDARQRVIRLGWEQFGELRIPPAAAFDIAYPIILRNAQIGLPLTTVTQSEIQTQELPLDRRKEISRGYHLVMIPSVITPQEATLTRDWLWVMGPETVATLNGISPEVVVKQFAEMDAGFRAAGFRIYEQMYGQ